MFCVFAVFVSLDQQVEPKSMNPEPNFFGVDPGQPMSFLDQKEPLNPFACAQGAIQVYKGHHGPLLPVGAWHLLKACNSGLP